MKNITQSHVKAMLLGVGLLLVTLSARAQTQKGADIDGEAAYDESGYSVSMPDANTVAIGAPLNGSSGQVRVYYWSGGAWKQKGEDIDGEGTGDYFGWSVSMPDANTVAIGAPQNNGNGFFAGHVRVYAWSGSAWVKKGLDIDGENLDDHSGSSLDMPDSNTVAIGAIYNDGNGMTSGQVRVYGWSGTSWVQKGSDIDGEASGDELGSSISMPDANTIAIGAIFNDGNRSDAGHVRVYSWNGSSWVQKGLDIDGKGMYVYLGASVSMPDANTVAIGCLNSDEIIYSWNGSDWVQKGNPISGEEISDQSGSSVSMPDANTVAIGAPWNAGNGTRSGNVRVYGWNGSTWIQKGLDIDGEADYDESGYSVSMPDASTIAIGAGFNAGNGLKSGHVRVYTVTNAVFVENSFGHVLRAFPNPTPGELNIDLGAAHHAVEVTVRNALGQMVLQQSFSDFKTLQVSIPGEAGLYMVEINSNDKKAILKVMKK